MMDEKAFWERVNGILDRRGNPLDDPEVLAYLEGNPAVLDAFAELRAGLALVEGGAPALPAASAGSERSPAWEPATAPSAAAPVADRRSRSWLPAAAAVLAASLLWMLWPPAERLSSDARSVPLAGVILDYEIRTTVSAPSVRTTRVADPKGWRVERTIEPGAGPALAKMIYQRRTSP